MRFQTVTVFALSCVLAGVTQAQTTPTPQAPPGTTSAQPLRHAPRPGTTTELPASAANVKPTDPVITLEGACKSAPASGCVTGVSRQQFEEMANSIKPGMTSDAKRNFAMQYAKILAFSDQARALGLENDQRFKQILQFVRNQLLVEAMNQYYSDEYSNQPDQKIDEYYKQNAHKFLEANLQRVIIPSQPAAAEVKKPSDEEEKAYVEKVRQQWVAGADPATLQKDALTRMGLNGSVPDVNLKNQSPGMFPDAHQSIFDLKPGEISQPFTDAGASYLYKMVSQQEKPIAEVKQQIAKTLHDQMMRDKIQEMTESVKPVLNDAYFGPEKKPEESPAIGAAQKPGEPPAQPNAPQSASPHK